MTEEEWLSGTDPDRFLKWLQKSKRHRPPKRKLLLFAVACARRVELLHTEPLSIRGLELAEELADGRAGAAEQNDYMRQAINVNNTEQFLHIAVWAVRVYAPESWSSPEGAARSTAGYAATHLLTDEPARQCEILRDIFGNPFRPVAFDPAWRTSTAVALAKGMYESRDFSAMPILADALQDAGCDNDTVLSHCRDANGVHVRGCWAVDLILGKA
jgi:hypothetical protein